MMSARLRMSRLIAIKMLESHVAPASTVFLHRRIFFMKTSIFSEIGSHLQIGESSTLFHETVEKVMSEVEAQKLELKNAGNAKLPKDKQPVIRVVEFEVGDLVAIAAIDRRSGVLEARIIDPNDSDEDDPEEGEATVIPEEDVNSKDCERNSFGNEIEGKGKTRYTTAISEVILELIERLDFYYAARKEDIPVTMYVKSIEWMRPALVKDENPWHRVRAKLVKKLEKADLRHLNRAKLIEKLPMQVDFREMPRPKVTLGSVSVKQFKEVMKQYAERKSFQSSFFAKWQVSSQ